MSRPDRLFPPRGQGPLDIESRVVTYDFSAVLVDTEHNTLSRTWRTDSETVGDVQSAYDEQTI